MPKFERGNPYGRRFKPGMSGNPRGRPPRQKIVEAMFEVVEEQDAARAISRMWLDKILAGDFAYFRAYLERCDGKVSRSTRSD